MKIIIASFSLLAFCSSLIAEEISSPYLSLKLESERAMSTGIAYLKSQQQPEGHWGDPTVTAITALALTSALRDPHFDREAELPDWIAKGYEYLRGCLLYTSPSPRD